MVLDIKSYIDCNDWFILQTQPCASFLIWSDRFSGSFFKRFFVEPSVLFASQADYPSLLTYQLPGLLTPPSKIFLHIVRTSAAAMFSMFSVRMIDYPVGICARRIRAKTHVQASYPNHVLESKKIAIIGKKTLWQLFEITSSADRTERGERTTGLQNTLEWC